MLKAKEYYLTKELLLLSFERLNLFFLFIYFLILFNSCLFIVCYFLMLIFLVVGVFIFNV
ncbi:hypothetical protein DD748_07340 [Helicobacter pylori]|nr:hypothetical protein DD748_07340 [Helicobacter pylori]